jgi:beta-glucosidase
VRKGSSGSAFPNRFAWGTGSSSAQCEGGDRDDGRGESVVDMWSRRPGAVWGGHTGAVANDHYHRYREDVALMKQVGLRATRLSIAWPRSAARGDGRAERDRPRLLRPADRRAGRSGDRAPRHPFHWDFPLALYRRGGWLNRDSAAGFADYTAPVVERLGDRVAAWITLNEPQIFIGLGHFEGSDAPGDTLNLSEAIRAGHHALLAHGRSVQAIRAAVPGATVGFAPVGRVRIPATDAPRISSPPAGPCSP